MLIYPYSVSGSYIPTLYLVVTKELLSYALKSLFMSCFDQCQFYASIKQ
jgi:hypothetical protein